MFIFALVLAGDHSHAETPLDAVGAALPQAIKAIVVGLVVGAVIALLSNVAEPREWMTEQSKRVILVATPLLAYVISVGVHGNGFVVGLRLRHRLQLAASIRRTSAVSSISSTTSGSC